MDDQQDFHLLYSKKYFDGDEYLNYELGKKVHRKNFQKKIKILKPHFSKRDIRILEIGAATGEFLKTAKENGIQQILGVEISDFAREVAIKDGLKVLSPFDPSLEKEIKALSPNLIVAWDVWEHIDCPSLVMKKYLELCSPDVIFAVTTVDSSSSVAVKRQEGWRQFHPPTHINYPTKKSFEIFFSKNHFKLLEHFHFGYVRPLAVYLAAVFGPKKWLKNSSLLFSVPLYLNLFDTQMVIAKRDDKKDN